LYSGDHNRTSSPEAYRAASTLGITTASLRSLAHRLSCRRGCCLHSARWCLAALRESERAFAAAKGRDCPEWLAYFDDAYLATKFGRCFRDLGRPVEAERFARRSLDVRDGKRGG
jgi:hypothetical protein